MLSVPAWARPVWGQRVRMRRTQRDGDGQRDGTLLTTVPRELRPSRVKPLPRSEPGGSVGSVSLPCRRMERDGGMRGDDTSVGCPLVTPSPCPTHVAAHRGQVIPRGEADTELWERSVPWGANGGGGDWEGEKCPMGCSQAGPAGSAQVAGRSLSSWWLW